MPSLPTHAVIALALGQCAPQETRTNWKFWFLAVLCSVLPDFDVIGFSFGIPYGDFWGHRGLTHSILFALLIGMSAGAILGGSLIERAANSFLLFAITCSHGVFDAMTNGGLGVAFFSPFHTTRYFLPWRPIQVSPIGLDWFFSARGATILWNEMLFVWLPIAAVGLILRVLGKRRKHRV